MFLQGLKIINQSNCFFNLFLLKLKWCDNMVEENISNKIRYIYFILTIGMVMYHSSSFDIFNIKKFNDFDNFALSLYGMIADNIGYVCMVFFFFMSGFWFYKGLESNKDTMKKCGKRIHTLLIPFLIWTVILGSYKICTSQITISFENIFYHIFESPIVGPLWYILGLLILQLFAPLVVLLKKKRTLLTLLFLMIIIYISLRNLGVIPKFLEFENWWWYNNLIFYMPVYIIGAYIGMYYPDILLKKEYDDKRYTYIGVLLIILVFIFWNYLIPDIEYLYIIYSIISIIGLWFILKPKLCSKKIPDFLDCGFYIYVLHNPVLIPITSKIIELILGDCVVICVEALLIKIIQICIIVIICAVGRKISSKIFPEKFYYYLTGGR